MITQTSSICPYCNTPHCIITDYSSGTIVCSNCAVVLEDRIIDEGNESRGFTDDNGNFTSRIGGPVNYEYFDELSGGVSIVKKNGKRLRSNISSASVSLAALFAQAEDIASSLNIPKKYFECSKDYLADLVRMNKIKGKSRVCVIAIVLYKVLYQNHNHKSLLEFSKRLNISMGELKRTYMAIQNFLVDDKKKEEGGSMIQFEGNVRLITMNMELSKEERKAIQEIGEAFIKSEIFTGKNPGTVASAVIYLVIKLLGINEISIKTLEKLSGLKEKTIKSTFMTMMNYLMLIPPQYKDNIKNLYS